jgi:hypothetical protein
MPFGSLSNQLKQFVNCVTRCQPIADIAFRGQIGKGNDAHGRGATVKGLSGLFGVLATSLIVVGQNDDLTPFKGLVINLRPLSCSHRVCCRDQSVLPEVIGVFFAFHDEDMLLSVSGEEFRQAIKGQRARDAFQIPTPFAVVRLAVGKPLRLVANGLEKQATAGVAVIVNGDDALRSLPAAIIVTHKQVSNADA